jgi:hypothetical protein
MFLKTDPKGNYSKAAVFLLVQNDRTTVFLLVHNGGLQYFVVIGQCRN